jgi:putative ABC transport system substrate-binding protein
MVLAAPLTAEGQQAGKVWRVGYLAGTPPSMNPVNSELWEAFRQRLQELGYVEGQHVVFERRFSGGQDLRFPELAAELVRLKVDVIVSTTGSGTVAAKEATSTIPIVIVGVSDPVGRGLATSNPRPGGNITGVADLQSDLNVKRLELLKAAVPKATRVANITSAAGHEPATLEPILTRQAAAAKALGVTLLYVYLNAPSEFDTATASALHERPDALLLGAVPLSNFFRKELAEFAVKHRLPSIAGNRGNATAGTLISYGPSYPDIFRRAAVYVDKILKGAKPGELPIDQPTKFELVINLKTAKALGLTIPPSLLGRADEIIQ